MSSFGSTLRIVCDITKCVVEVNQNKRSCDEDIDAIFKLFDKFKKQSSNYDNNGKKITKKTATASVQCNLLK
jgi:hypothetical protein